MPLNEGIKQKHRKQIASDVADSVVETALRYDPSRVKRYNIRDKATGKILCNPRTGKPIWVTLGQSRNMPESLKKNSVLVY